MAAVAALGLAACAPEETEDAPAGDAEGQVETEDQTEATPDDAAGEETTPAETEPTDEATEEPTAEATDQATGEAGDSAVHQALEAVLAEYPDGVITEFDDEGSYVEVFVFDGSTEWELEVDAETFEIIDTEDDGIDSDDQRKAQAVEIDIAEALEAAETEGEADVHSGELDEEDGTVVYQIELTNDVEVYVDVTNAEVVNVDR
ncbi:PepSY domain-containing protein [Nesterenkonia sp.]|uniref:PepSY domain-containing protein n=1 Tax=Nesterenkonia sp. TaxID=704201 RepID=UPI00261F81A0|nr:PepSY domain-containing protein [Nesterenkonia sp.]